MIRCKLCSPSIQCTSATATQLHHAVKKQANAEEKYAKQGLKRPWYKWWPSGNTPPLKRLCTASPRTVDSLDAAAASAAKVLSSVCGHWLYLILSMPLPTSHDAPSHLDPSLSASTLQQMHSSGYNSSCNTAPLRCPTEHVHPPEHTGTFASPGPACSWQNGAVLLAHSSTRPGQGSALCARRLALEGPMALPKRLGCTQELSPLPCPLPWPLPWPIPWPIPQPLPRPLALPLVP